MLQLKKLSKESIPQAIERAKHYRLLNEPWQAESICRDILKVEPENQSAILNLLLAITDQFHVYKRALHKEAVELSTQLTGKYEQLYYRGLVEERLGKAALNRSSPRVKYIAYEYYHKAMEFYEEADKIHSEGNQDAVLRWNACARSISEFNLQPSPEEDGIPHSLE